MSIKYLKCWDNFVDDDTVQKTPWADTTLDEMIVEAIACFLSDAIKIRCGNFGSWAYNVGPNPEYFHIAESYKTFILDHGNVHLTGRYCLKVEEAIEKELGARFEE